jgi:hypothetical protein
MRPDVDQEWRESGAFPELSKLATEIREDINKENTCRSQQNRECDGFHFYLPAMGTEIFGIHARQQNARSLF